MMLTPKIKALSAKESESRAALRDMLEMQRKEKTTFDEDSGKQTLTLH